MSKAVLDVQWAFISILTSSIAHFLLRIFLGKELGPEGLGVYTLAFTIYLFGTQFAGFGIGSALTKYVAEFIEDHTTIRNYVSSGMISSIIIGTLMCFLLFLISPFIAVSFFKIPDLEGLIKLTALCYPFIAIQKAVLGTLNGFRRMHLFAVVNIAQNVSIVILSIILVMLFGMGVLGAVIGYVIPTFIISIISPILIRDSLGSYHFTWHNAILRSTTIFGFYIVLGNSISFLNTQFSSILIGFYLNPIEVGVYTVAMLFAQIITLLPSAVQSVTAPATSSLYGKGNITQVKNFLFSTMKKIFIISILTAVLIAIFGQYLIVLLFSYEFLSAYVPLLLLLIGYTIFAPFMAIGATLSSIGKVHIPFRIHAICCILSIILNILLIPQFGIIGAAIATSITLIVSFGINVLIINRYLTT